MAIASIHNGGTIFRKKKFRAGASIHDMVMAFNPESKDWELPTICLVNNAPVPRRDWGRFRPEHADLVTFRHLPLGGGGGGSNPMQVIASLVVAVLAVYTGGLAAGALGLVKGTAAYGLVSGLTTAVVMAAGGYLAGQIFGVKNNISQGEEDTATYNNTVANNLARLGQPEPEQFGRMRQISDRATNSWTIYSGNDQYLHQVFVTGRGFYEYEKLYFGDTPIWTRENGVEPTYDIEVEFYEPGQPVTLFPNNVEVSTEVSGQQFFTPDQEEYSGWLGPYSTNPPGTVTDRIVNHVTFPAGVGRTNDSGKIRTIDIDLRFEFRPIDDQDNPLGEWAQLMNPHIIMGTATPQRISYESPVALGRYQIRAKREGIHQVKFMDTTLWEGLIAFLPGDLTYGVSTVALRTKATNVLSQSSASRFGVVCTRKLPLWDRDKKVWSAPQPTRSFAAAVSQAARADYGGKLPDDRIDLDSLWRIDELLTAKGWTFDGYFDSFYTIWSLIVDMCSPFGVLPRVTAGRLGFAYDEPGRPVRHIFTPRNIVRDSFTVVYNTFTEETPDDVTVQYLDEDVAYQQREVSAALPDSESGAPSTKSFIGVVNRAQAFYMGVRMAAGNRHRRLEYTWQTEGMGRIIAVGDVVSINHPYLATILTGFINDWDESVLEFDLGHEIVLADEPLWLTLNGRDGRPWGPCLIKSAEGTKVRLDPDDYELILQQRKNAGRSDGNPFEWVSAGENGLAAIWKIESGPEYENRAIVTAIKVVDRFQYEITAVNDPDEAYGYQDLEVPPWKGRENIPAGTELAAPENIEAGISGNEEEPIIVLSWLPVPGAASYLVGYSADGSNWVRMADVYINEARILVEPGRAWIRMAARNSEIQSPWTVWEGNTKDMFLPAVEFHLSEPYYGADLKIEWEPSEYSPINYTVSILPQSDKVARSTPLGLSETYNYTPAMGLADGGPWREMIVRLETDYPNGLTMSFESAVYDPAPEAPAGVTYETMGNTIAFTGVTFEGEIPEHSGYVIARGSNPDFGLEEVLDFKILGELPYEWEELAPNATYYFRIAARDSFFDFTLDYLDLNFSDVISIML